MSNARYVINACWRDWATGMPVGVHDTYHGLVYDLGDAIDVFDAVTSIALRQYFPRRQAITDIASIDGTCEKTPKSNRLVYRIELRKYADDENTIVKEWQMPFTYWRQLAEADITAQK